MRRAADPGSFEDRIRPWIRAGWIAAGTGGALGLAAFVGSGSSQGLAFPAAVVAVGVGGGLAAHRKADLLGVLPGSVVVFELIAAVEVAQHGGPAATFGTMLGAALIPAGFAMLLGMAVLLLRQVVGKGLLRLGVRSGLVNAVLVGSSLVGLAWIVVLVASRSARIDTFHLTGEREIAVTVIGGQSTWCRVTGVRETDTDVTVGAACLSLILGPTLAVGIPTDLTIQLARPLGDRSVRNEDGSDVRQASPAGTR